MSKNNAPTSTPVDGALKQSLKEVVAAVESLMHTTVEQTNSEYRKARATLDSTLAGAREHIVEDTLGAIESTKEIGDRSDRFVRSNPWTAVGIGAATGLVLGLLLRRR